MRSVQIALLVIIGVERLAEVLALHIRFVVAQDDPIWIKHRNHPNLVVFSQLVD